MKKDILTNKKEHTGLKSYLHKSRNTSKWILQGEILNVGEYKFKVVIYEKVRSF